MRLLLALLAVFATLFTQPAGAQTVPFPPSPKQLVAVNPVTNKVYVVNESANSVTVLNAATNTTATIPVGNRPQFIVVNPITNRVFVNNGGEASLTVIDGATDTNLTPTPLAVGSQGPMAVNIETNIVYIVRMTSVATDEVSFFNAASNTWYTIATESFQPTALAINPVTNTLYVAHYGTGDVRVISGAFDNTNLHPETFSIAAWSKPFAIAANSMTNKIYVITEDSRGPIGIINGATRAADFPLPTSGHAVGPKAIAVNPLTNRIYAAFNNEVIVINGSTNAYTYIPVATGTGVASIAINYFTNKIYVSNDAGTLTVIDGATNATSTLTIPAGTISLGMNPVTNEVYAAGGTTGIADGVAGTTTNPPLATNINPLPGNASGPGGSITMTAANAFPNPLPVRGVYFQLDSKEGAWTRATGSGPYTATYSGLSAGSHTIHAFAVEGHVAPTDTGQQSNPLVGAIASYTFTVGSASTATVSLASSVNPSSVGQSVTFTAAVTGSGATPTGTVTFTDGAATLCSAVTMTSGSAACTTSGLIAGAHTITASYSGDAAYGTGSESVTQTVNKLAPRVTLGSSQNPSTTGQSVTFTASVSGSGAAPTGTVAFKDGTSAITGCASVTVVSGSASCSTTALLAGSHSITAQYSGDATYTSATSTAVTQTVQDAPTGPSINVALAANGGSVSASSTASASFPASSLINGDRAGNGWGAGGGWKDATANTYPDWVQLDFNGGKTVERVVVYSLQDNPGSPVEPSDSMTFTSFGATDFVVEGWTGSAWTTLATVTGNNKVKRTVTFSPYTTTRIRVTINNAVGGYSRLVEIEAWTTGTSAPPVATNVAAASAGAVASASSVSNANFPVASLNDGDRAGEGWGAGGGWKDATAGAFPDWVAIDFDGAKTIDRVVVFSLQDSPASPVEPGDSMTFTNFGARDFVVEAWNGSAWTTLATVTGNNLVKRNVTFPAVTTARIRVSVTAVPGGDYSRLVEIEAYGVPAGSPARINAALASNGGSASASSSGGSAFPVASLINGDRAGMSWGAGGGWRDATANVYPDWVEIAFSAAKTIDTVVVYSLQDNPMSPSEPTESMTFASFGATGFTVETWNGSAWVMAATVTGNHLVKRAVSFAPVSTTKIRVQVTATPSNYSRLAEVEAWGS